MCADKSTKMDTNAQSPVDEKQISDTALNQNTMENENVTSANADAIEKQSTEMTGQEMISDSVETTTETTAVVNGNEQTAEAADETGLPVAETMTAPQPEPVSEPAVEVPAATIIETAATEEQFLESQPAVIPHEEEHEEIVSVNYHELSKEELLQHLNELLNEENAVANKNKAFAIRDVFNQIVNNEKNYFLNKHIDSGGTKEDFQMPDDEIAIQFFAAFEQYKKKRTEQLETQEKQKAANLTAKHEILNQLKVLIQNEENMQRAYNEFNELQNRWRAIGAVPSGNVQDLHMTYKLYVDRFYDFVKINKELQALDQKKNLLQKINLCEKAEELMLEPSINKAVARINDYMNQWREIGLVSRDKQQEIWDRFKAAVDKVFEKRREFEAQMHSVYEANLAAKKELADKAELIASGVYDKHNAWQDALKLAVELQQQFKAIGFAPRKENELVWTRFKTALDSFFRSKNDFYQSRKKELAANLQQKTELCVQAEALKESTDWKNTANQLKHLQEEWKKIGPVAEKFNQKIWQRFKEACDAFFNNRKAHFENVDKEYDDNYTNKIKLIEEIENFQMHENNGESLDQLKAFQRQFTEIGLVPMAKKDEVHQRYRKAIDALYNKLNMDERDKTRMRYDEKIDNLKQHPAGKGKMKDEHHFLQNKIKELAGEVTVWQNNIGFFGRSKGAEVIKKEFEEKIKKAQDEISVLKEKLETLKKAE